jgi:methyl-accepting chemotaxis protein
MNSMSLKNKLILLVAILLAFCSIVGIVGYTSANKISHNYGKIADSNLPNITALLEGLAHMRSARIYTLELALPNQSEAFQKDMTARIETEVAKYDEEDKIYNNIPFGEGEEAIYKPVKEQVDLLKKAIKKAVELHEKSAGKEGPSMESMRQVVNGDIMTLGKTFRDELNKLLEWHRLDIKNNVTSAHDAQKSGSTVIIAGLIGALALGGILSFIVLKNIMAEQEVAAKATTEAIRSSNMIDNATNPMMSADLDGKLLSINKVGKDNLKKLQSHLSANVDDMVGKSIDIFHGNSSVIKRIISDPKNLPHRAVISIGPEKLQITVAAIFDSAGKFTGPMVTWEIVTEKIVLVNNLTKASEDLAKAATNVLSISSNLSAAAEETSAQANTASVASEEVNAGVQTVASNMVEMVAAIKEITKTTNEAASMTNEAMRITKNTNTIINKLGDSSMDIGNVIKVISSIAQQTNLLALNATIEAARAGEAGKGFAVVANEVKELANQTAKATSEITKKIETIQSDSKSAMEAIAEISGAIEKVNGFTGNIASSVEEQAATTNEVTRIVAESAEGVKQINENISQVSLAAANTGKDAGSAQVAARGVGETAELLKKYVAQLRA